MKISNQNGVMTPDSANQACQRINDGEKIVAVALSFGLTESEFKLAVSRALQIPKFLLFRERLGYRCSSY